MKGAEPLRIDAVPTPDADWQEIAEFANTFNGYKHFGDTWADRYSEASAQYRETGALPDNIDDLRGVLFLEFRADRSTWGTT